MSYATIAQFVESFGLDEAVALTNLDQAAATVVNNSTLQRSLDDASGEIDAYLVSRYALPLETTPAALVHCCYDIARYRLDRNNPREDVRQRYEDTIDFLKLVAKGTVSLVGVAPLSAGSEAATGGAPQWIAKPTVFTDERLGGF